MILDYLIITVVAVTAAFNYHLFVINNDFAPSGLNGIAAMVQYLFGFSIGYMSLIINIPLCIAAYFMVSREFAFKSFAYCAIHSAVYLMLDHIDLSRICYTAQGAETIFPCLIASIVGGIGYGLCFRQNGSTGGVDIIAKYINKRWPLLNFFWVIFAINAVVAFISYFVYSVPDPITGARIYNYEPVCLCVLYCFVSSYIGDRIIKGTKSAYKFVVVTNHAEEISREIINRLHHSATRLNAYGAYSHEGREMIVCVVGKHQIVAFKNILDEYDGTFAYIETATEIIGNFRK